MRVFGAFWGGLGESLEGIYEVFCWPFLGGLGFREFRVPEGIYEVFFGLFWGGLGFREYRVPEGIYEVVFFSPPPFLGV